MERNSTANDSDSSASIAIGVRLLLILATVTAAICHRSLLAQEDLLALEEAAIKQAASYGSRFAVQVETFAGLDLVDGVVGSQGATTGTILHEDGWIVCSLYPFRNQPASITVVMSDGSRVSAKLIARDFSRELALIKITPKAPLAAPEVSPISALRVGQWVIALGKAMRSDQAAPSVGIVSAKGRAWDRAIQTDAKVSPLNYGGPLIDLQGRVIGIITPIHSGVASESEVQQWYDSGIGFAIPLEDILPRLPRLQSGVDIHPGKLGIRSSVNDDYAGPIVLLGVSPGSPAAEAGMKRGDRILAVQGVPIETLAQFRHAIGPIDAEQKVTIELQRDEQRLTVECRLAKEIPIYREPFLGILPALGNDKLVQIAQVLADSPADRAGLKTGEVIEQFANQPVNSVETLSEAIAFQDSSATVTLVIRASEQARTIDLRLSPWPTTLDQSLQKLVPPAVADENPVGNGLVPIELGDLPNKCVAFIPPSYRADIPHGLAIAFAEAGEVDIKLWTDAWGPFCRDHRWMLVVLGSRDKSAWSFEELELIDRVLFPMMNDYNIDRRRVCLGGVGTGGFLALVGGFQNINRVRGVWMIEPKLMGGLRFPSSEPLESLRILAFGEKQALSKQLQASQKLGHHLILQDGEPGEPSSAPKVFQPKLENWLRLFEAL